MNPRDLLIKTTIALSAASPVLTSVRPLGSFSLGGAISFWIFVASLALLLSRKIKLNYAIIAGTPLTLLCMLNTIGYLKIENNSNETNVSIFIWPTLLFLLILTSSAFDPERLSKSLKKAMEVSSSIYIIVALYSAIKYGHSPAVALAGLPFFCFAITQLSSKNKLYLIPITLIFISHILLSARIVVITEILISVYLLVFMRGTIATKPILLALLATVAYLAISSSSILSKTISTGDNALEIGGLTINTSGRIKMWEYILEASMKSPIIGSGLAVPEEISTIPSWAHPHNDYLRLLHQTGFSGLLLWIIFITMMIRKTKIALSQKTSQWQLRWHEASLLMTISMSIAMLTDNPIVYSYVVYPMAILMGMSIAAMQVKTPLENRSRAIS